MSENWLTCRRVCVVGIAVWFAVAQSALGASTPTLEEAVAIIAAHESRISVFSCEIETTLWTLPPDGNVQSAQRDGPSRALTSVLFEPQTGHYRVSYERLTKWSQGVDPYYSDASQAGYDGFEFRVWRRGRPGTTIPDQSCLTEGEIATDDSAGFDHDGFLTGWPGISLGISNIPPLFDCYLDRNPMRLSTFLRAQVATGRETVVEDLENHLRIHTRWQGSDGSKEWIHIDYDHLRGAIRSALWNGESRSLTNPWRRLEVDLEETSDGIWMPKEIRAIAASNRPQTMTRYAYRNFRINPPITRESFTISFPVGTRVKDTIQQKQYLVGPDPVHQAAAVRSFLEANEVTLSDPPPSKRPIYALWLVSIFLGLVLAFVLHRWHRKRGRGASFLQIGAFSLMVGIATTTGRRIEGSETSSSISANAVTPAVLNCGHLTTLGALQLLGIRHDPMLINELLAVDDEGVSAGDIRDVLLAHGLSVQARRASRINELTRVFDHDTIALLAVPGGLLREKRHYFIALRDAKRGLILCDILLGVRQLEKAIADEVRTKEIELAMLISRPHLGSPVPSTEVLVSPQEIEIGHIPVTGPGNSVPVTSQFWIQNLSRMPVLVTGVATGCGCSRAKWQPGMIRPGDRLSIEYSLIPGAWGHGRSTRRVDISFADGGIKSVTTSATGVSAAEIQRLEITPTRVQIDAPAFTETNPEAVCKVSGIGRSVTSLTATSSQSWLQARIEKAPTDTHASIIISVVASAPDLKRLHGVESEIVGSILVRADKDSPAEEIHVKVARPSIRMAPGVINVKTGSEALAHVEFAHDKPLDEHRLRIVAVESRSNDLTVEFDRDRPSAELRVRAADTTSPGRHLIRITVEDGNSRAMGTMLVVVVEKP